MENKSKVYGLEFTHSLRYTNIYKKQFYSLTMVSKTGNRLCSESELIEAIFKDYRRSNKTILAEFLNSTQPNEIILLNCSWFREGRTMNYEVIGRLKCKFAPTDCDIPEGVFIERRDGEDFVPYREIVTYHKLVEEKT